MLSDINFNNCKKEKIKITEEVIWRVLSQIWSALQSCHNKDNKVIHRDIKPGNIFIDKWMNEFLEQLVRDLTNAYSRSQWMFGERVSPGPANQRSFHGLPCCWGQLLKATSSEPSDWLCSVSLPISVFFMHSLRDVLRKGQGTTLNAAAS